MLKAPGEREDHAEQFFLRRSGYFSAHTFLLVHCVTLIARLDKYIYRLTKNVNIPPAFPHEKEFVTVAQWETLIGIYEKGFTNVG
jgi:hypothetical protein